MQPRKLIAIKTFAIHATDGPALATALNSWLATNAKEKSFVQVEFVTPVAGGITAMIVYTE